MRARFFAGPFALLVLSAPSVHAQGRDAVRPEDQDESRTPRETTGSSAFANALRLARMLNDDRVIVRLLTARALAKDASASEISEMVESLEASGKPERAEKFLEQRLVAFPDDTESRVRLAELLTRSGHSKDALAVWRDLDRRIGIAGLTTAQADAYARVLSRQGQTEEAFRVLKAARPAAGDEARDYWDDLGSLAWELDAPADALFAYRKLWAQHDSRRGVPQRLMTLATEAGAKDEAIAVGIEDFKENGDTSSLVQSARLQAEKQDWTGVKRTLVLADAMPGLVARNEDYWTLRGEAAGHLHDPAGARGSYEAVLAIDPESATAKSELLSGAIEQNDLRTLRTYVDRWHTVAVTDGTLWSAYALALDRLGRTREALAFYAREVRAAPGDHVLELEFADALDRVGYGTLAHRVRRYAFGKLARASLEALLVARPTAEQRSLAEEGVQAMRDAEGAETGERWFRAMLTARGPTDTESDPFALEWCLAQERLDCARRIMGRYRGKHTTDPKWRGYRLELALADDDHHAIKDILANPKGLDPNDRIEALLAVEKDSEAASAIAETLDGAPVEGQDTWRRHLIEIYERHAPNARAGGTYEYIGGLDAYGVDVGASHDVGPLRLLYSASERQMGTRNGSLLLKGTVDEADGFVLSRFTTPRGVTEVGAGANYQTGAPLPRASLFDERLVTAQLGYTLHLAMNDKIEDTGLLRAAAAQYIGELVLRDDIGRVAYAQIDLHAREDHTRRLHHVGAEVGEVAEVGYKIWSSTPEWDVGLQALAHQRENVGVLPSDIAPLVPRNQDLAFYLPPSYQLISIVTHITRGDFLERYRPDRSPFPRYDCALGVGILFPDLDGAFEAECKVSFLTTHDGYVSAVGNYNRGVFGISNQTNAEASLQYTQPF